MTGRLVLVGGGKMGGALLAGWLDRGRDPSSITVVEPEPAAAATIARKGVGVVDAADALAHDADAEVVVFAVKPQAADAVIPAYRRFVTPATVFLSIMAGRTIRFLEDRLGGGAAVVRSMPNTPAAVGRGMTVACANAAASPGQRQACQLLLEAVGEVAWVGDEALLDAVTALSGSGPAYVFLLVECLAQAGVEAGLAPDLAGRLARATVSGAGELLRLSPETAETLRRNVTSPGGTTAEALRVLMGENGLQPLLSRAVAAAAERSRQLAG